MGNYPTKPPANPFQSTIGSMTDEGAIYTTGVGQKVKVQAGDVAICKIYQMGTEIFAFDENHNKIKLSENGKIKTDAKELVKGAKGYGSAMVMVGGSLKSPVFTSAVTGPNTNTWDLVNYKSWNRNLGASIV